MVSPLARWGPNARRSGHFRGYYRAEENRGDPAKRQGSCGDRKPRQEPIPSEYEPRDSHAHEWHLGNDYAGPRDEFGCRAARRPEHGQELGGIPADASERHYGSFEN